MCIVLINSFPVVNFTSCIVLFCYCGFCSLVGSLCIVVRCSLFPLCLAIGARCSLPSAPLPAVVEYDFNITAGLTIFNISLRVALPLPSYK